MRRSVGLNSWQISQFAQLHDVPLSDQPLGNARACERSPMIITKRQSTQRVDSLFRKPWVHALFQDNVLSVVLGGNFVEGKERNDGELEAYWSWITANRRCLVMIQGSHKGLRVPRGPDILLARDLSSLRDNSRMVGRSCIGSRNAGKDEQFWCCLAREGSSLLRVASMEPGPNCPIPLKRSNH